MSGFRLGAPIWRRAIVGMVVSFTVVVGASRLLTPTTITGTAGAADTAAVGSPVTTTPQVRITDSIHAGLGVAGVKVTFSIDSGGGSSLGDTVYSNLLGYARVGSWNLGASGRNVMKAHAAGLKGNPVKFVAIGTDTASPPAPTHLTVSSGNHQTATVSTAVTFPPKISLTDQFFAPFAGDTITFHITGGGGTLSSDSIKVTDASGLAAPTSWTLGSSPGVNTLTATAKGAGISGNPLTFTDTAKAAAAGGLPKFVQGVTCDTATVTPAHKCVITGVTAGDALVAIVRTLSENRAVDSVRGIHGELWTSQAVVPGNNARVTVFTAPNLAAGTDTVKAYIGSAGGSGNSAVIVTEYSGVDTLSPVDVENDSGSTGSTISVVAVTATTTKDSDLIVPFGLVESASRPQLVKSTGLTFGRARDSLLDASVELAVWDTLQLTAGSTVVRDTVTGGNGILNFGWLALKPGGGGGGGGGGGMPGPVDSIVSTVTAVTPVSTGSSSTVTVTALDAASTPISGKTVTFTVSGSGNTVNQPGSTTNGSGVTTGTFSSTVAETKTVTATADGVVLHTRPTVTVTSGGGGGGTLILQEDFSTYSSTANLLADPRGIYSVGEDVNTSDMVLDNVGCTGVGSCTSSKSMRFDYPARAYSGGCSDNTIGRNLNLPSDQADVYVEIIAKFSSTWTNDEGCASYSPHPVNADFKMIFGRVRSSGRFNVMVGTYNSEYTVGYPGGEDNFEGHALTTEWDGNWHVWRMHFKVGSSGACKVWIDGTVVKDYGVVSMAANLIYGIALGRNINQGPPAPQSLWFGQVKVYNTDPGW